MKVALIREVFVGHEAAGRLAESLREARRQRADLALLPELPLCRWCPAFDEPQDADAEPPHGPCHSMLSAAAREAGIGVVGGAIVSEDGIRHNVTFVLDALGSTVGAYRKLHLPCEPGFWETGHYEPGTEAPRVIDGFDLRLGIQVCSDVNRPEGTHILAALGAEAILSPRATEAATYDRWRTVLIANALTSCAYVLSVPRPRPENGVPLGGPSIAIAPDGEVLAESEAPMVVVTLEAARVHAARKAYPGYMPVRADVYARGWDAASRMRAPMNG